MTGAGGARRGLGGKAGLLAAVLGLSAVGAPASAVETWRSVPLWGGDVTSVVFSPADPHLAIAGTAGGQIYLTRDDGANWTSPGAVFPLPGWIVASLQFDPNRPTRVWAALRGVFGGGAIVRSDDLGRTWETRAERPSDDPVFSLALVPGEEGRLFLGSRTGVWGSTDGASTWKLLSKGQSALVEVWSLLVHPQHPQTVIAGTYRRAFRSDDGGATWRGVFDGMVLDSQVFTLNPVPGDPNQVWASTCGWVYKSDDLGERWTRMREGLFERRTPAFTALPNGRLLAGTVSGVYVSDDKGGSWARRTRDDISVSSVAYHPKRPELVLVGTEGSGVWRSTDGGTSFFPANRGIAAARVTALARTRGEVLASVAHGGPISGIYGVLAGGERVVHEMSRIPTVLGLAATGDEAWAATEGGLFARRDGLWERVGEMPAVRVEQVVAADGRVLARTVGGLFELRGGRFTAVDLPAPATSAAVFGGQVMVAGTEGAWLLADGGPRPLTVPASGQLGSVGGRLVLSGNNGFWSRGGADSRWRSHLDGRARVVPTGDSAYPAVVIDDAGAKLFVGADRTLRPLRLPVPARDVLAAAVDGGRLLLGTSGFGILYARLDELVPPPPAGAGAVAAGTPQ